MGLIQSEIRRRRRMISREHLKRKTNIRLQHSCEAAKIRPNEAVARLGCIYSPEDRQPGVRAFSVRLTYQDCAVVHPRDQERCEENEDLLGRFALRPSYRPGGIATWSGDVRPVQDPAIRRRKVVFNFGLCLGWIKSHTRFVGQRARVADSHDRMIVTRKTSTMPFFKREHFQGHEAETLGVGPMRHQLTR
jgi:hypothetical protein